MTLPKRLVRKKKKAKAETKPKARYRERDGFEVGGKYSKTADEKFITVEALKEMLDMCPRMDAIGIRDHAIIKLSFAFGLRSGEAIILNRAAFRKIDQGVAYIRRLKNRPRIHHTCTHCKRRMRVKMERIGKKFRCGVCGMYGKVEAPLRPVVDEDPEREVTLVEDSTIEYIIDYMKNCMEPGQDWLFVRYYKSAKYDPVKSSEHITTRHVRRIFSTYAQESGLGKIYSPHCLRHARGVYLYDAFDDLMTVAEGLGHASMKISEMYTAMSPKRRAARRAEINKSDVFKKG